MSNRIDQLDRNVRTEFEGIISEIKHKEDITDAAWKKSTEAIFRAHGFDVKTQFVVPSRDGTDYRGKVGLVCVRGDLTIAMEFGHKSVRRKAVVKLDQVSTTAIRLVGSPSWAAG